MATEPSGNFLSAAIASIVARRRVLIGAAVLVGLAWVSNTVWRAAQAPLRSNPDFQISAERVQISQPPAWVREDIRVHAIERARSQGPLTIIDPKPAVARIAEAFRREPWVRRVERVELTPPNGAAVELEYRTPLAAVELSTPAGLALTPVDAEGVRLPSAGLDNGRLRRLPRVRRITGAPPEGEVWTSPQVIGAVALINAFGPRWDALKMAYITPSDLPQIRDDRTFYQFELLTVGGTKILWGAAPGAPVDEPAFEAKVATLQRFVQQNNVRLDGLRSPQSIDLRQGIQATKRIAKKKTGKRTASAPQTDEVVK